MHFTGDVDTYPSVIILDKFSNGIILIQTKRSKYVYYLIGISISPIMNQILITYEFSNDNASFFQGNVFFFIIPTHRNCFSVRLQDKRFLFFLLKKTKIKTKTLQKHYQKKIFFTND